MCFYPWHTGLEISPSWVVQLPRNSRKLQLLHWPENGFNLYCFILPVGNYPLFSSTPARKKRKNSANPTHFCMKPSMQLDHSLPWGVLASSIQCMDCFPSSGFIVAHPHRSFYRQIYGCLIKDSLKTTGWWVQLVHQAGARGVGLQMLQKRLFLGVIKSWLKGLCTCQSKAWWLQLKSLQEENWLFGCRGRKKLQYK